ncbi:ATP-binding protein [Porphyromonadaceae bacterium W3.11]|nr:ATP-binding protein [Porphyromonadaceae bacterium W3.11]
MKTTFSKKIFYPTLGIIALFMIGLIINQQKIEHDMKFDALASKLEAYNDLIHLAYEKDLVPEVKQLLPTDLRVTIIENEGKVLRDTEVDNVGKMELHDTRPELQEARFHTLGSDIRKSVTTGKKTLYVANFYQNYYIRTALPYNHSLKSTLTSSNYFIIISLLGFFLISILLYFLLRKYDRTIAQLKKVGEMVVNGHNVTADDFPESTGSGISSVLLAILEQKQKNNDELEESKDRLVSHFQLSNTGIALFNKDNEVEYTNSHFIQYANILSTSAMTQAKEFLNEHIMLPIKRFIEDHDSQERSTAITVAQGNKIFAIKALKSGGGKFEITIEDVTEEEKNRQLKQEMTSNVTHEIRTPLTSIRGYLETLNYMDLTEEKRNEFIEKAFQQTIRLSEMMDDISLLSKLDEESRSFEYESVNLYSVVEELRVHFSDIIIAQNNTFINKLDPDTKIKGNRSLINSIFRNLMENTLRYAGPGVEMVITQFHQDNHYLYFSYYDTGTGVSEEHMNRLFERFYRVDSGRTRATGGSGLGLSIVKNSVLLHGGQIQARRHTSGGLEIHFNLHR